MTNGGLPRGREHLCFDSTALMAFAAAGHLDLLGSWFTDAYAPHVVIAHEVGDWVEKYPHNQDILDATWLHAVPVDEASDIQEVTRIRRDHFGSDPGKDFGEAEVIVLCQRYGWTAVLDDDTARDYATRHTQVASSMMLTVILAAAAHGLIKPTDAWKVHQDVDAKRGSGRSFLTGQPVHRPAFMKSVDEFKTIRDKKNVGEWPKLLSLRGLDDVPRLIRNRTLRPEPGIERRRPLHIRKSKFGFARPTWPSRPLHDPARSPAPGRPL